MLAGGFMTDGTMVDYQRKLKHYSRDLRNQMTIAESMVQKPLLNYIVNFYANRAKLVVECDGSQHLEEAFLINDQERDAHLNQEGILVLRFTNIQIFKNLDSMLTVIWENVSLRISASSKFPTR